MEGVFFIARFVVGLAVGSFINVLAMRYDPARPIFKRTSTAGRSHCTHCHAKLAWYELVPLVSYLVQLGRCRRCRARLSLQYPMSELASGLIVAYTPRTIFTVFGVGFMPEHPWWYYLLAVLYTMALLALLFISLVDLRLRVIPDQATLLVALLGLGAAAVHGRESFIAPYDMLFTFSDSPVFNYALAGAVGFVSFAVIFLASRGRAMGFGDVKLAPAIGLLLGWPDAVLAIALSFVIGAVVSSPLLIARRWGRRATVPFGPFMALGTAAVIFFGSDLVSLYFQMFP